MRISELNCCPFCGGEGFYIKNYMCGTCNYNYSFNGEELDNSQMYDGLRVIEGKRAYCINCNRYLATNNILGKNALLALKEQ